MLSFAFSNVCREPIFLSRSMSTGGYFMAEEFVKLYGLVNQKVEFKLDPNDNVYYGEIL